MVVAVCRRDCLDVLRKMLLGSTAAVRTELTTQMEEQGFIPAIFQYLKDQHEAVRRRWTMIAHVATRAAVHKRDFSCRMTGASESCCGGTAQNHAR